MAGLVWRLVGRALPRPRVAPLPDLADHTADDAVFEALMAGDTAALDRIGPGLATARSSDRVPLLLEAVAMGNLTCVTWFLRHGADVTARDGGGQTAIGMVLRRAVFHDPADEDLWIDDCPAILAALVSAGADVNAPGPMGLPALHHMAVLGAMRQVDWLLSAGADPLRPDSSATGLTAAEHARKAGKTAIAARLDAAGRT